MIIRNIIIAASFAILSTTATVALANDMPSRLEEKKFYYTTEFSDSDTTTFMQSYTIDFPDGIDETQFKTIYDATVQLMSVKPGQLNGNMDFDEFKPMPADMITIYAPKYANGETGMENWYDESVVDVVSGGPSNMIVMKVVNYFYSGGAHGGESHRFVNYNKSTGRIVTLDDYVKSAAAKDALRNYLYQQAKKEYGDLIGPKSDFPLPDQFQVTDNGLNFVYQLYEIGPYMMGIPEFLVSNAQLKAFNGGVIRRAPTKVMPKKVTKKVLTKKRR